MYIPQFKISTGAINLIADITAMIERYAVRLEQNDAIAKSTNATRMVRNHIAILKSAGIIRRGG